jgi:hypothetical protein
MWNQGDQMIWKKFAQFLKSGQNRCHATIQTMFLNSLFWWKCTKIVAQGIAFLGHFFNEYTKSSLIGEKLPNLVTLRGTFMLKET